MMKKVSLLFLARYNRQKAVTISARLVGDYSLDEALKFLVNIVEQNTPQAKHTIPQGTP